MGGRVSFNAFRVREQGLHRELARRFGHLKTGRGIVCTRWARRCSFCSTCPSRAASGCSTSRCSPPTRCSCTGARAAASQASTCFTTISGASTRRLSRTSKRCSPSEAPLRCAPTVCARCSSTSTPRLRRSSVHKRGAAGNPNPRYHGRPSYHPILARIQRRRVRSSGLACGPVTEDLEELDVEDVEQWLDRTRAAAGPAALITMRIDAGGDCAPLLRAIDGKGAWFLVKMKQTPNLVGTVWATQRWITVDRDAFGKPTRPGRRDRLRARGLATRKVARLRDAHQRAPERRAGRPLGRPGLLGARLRHQRHRAQCRRKLARRYDERAGIEAGLRGGSRAALASAKSPPNASTPTRRRSCSRCSPSTCCAAGYRRAIRPSRRGALSGFAASASRSQGDSCAPEGATGAAPWHHGQC